MKKKQRTLPRLRLKKAIISDLNLVTGGNPGDNNLQMGTGVGPCLPISTQKSECMSLILICYSAFCGPKPTFTHCY
ncbi:hypothetical protein [Taibaiella chishuiensis]|uniref:Uncharacterized protein n=1 Tax=Taibaiella chishuiensis TaxID=1434707 RepID=A0A2P8D0J2_9BACT|nr:hypothetical protein [Taibaiella chishuiensis]PSK90742.1 hypothetical protein B0I18_107152 [Taibaiella chishuiensis]